MRFQHESEGDIAGCVDTHDIIHRNRFGDSPAAEIEIRRSANTPTNPSPRFGVGIASKRAVRK